MAQKVIPPTIDQLVYNTFSKVQKNSRLLRFLNNTHFFKSNQFGFLPNRNVTQAIKKTIKTLNDDEPVLFVKLDISKAYDSA